jgi:hypothetical protein
MTGGPTSARTLEENPTQAMHNKQKPEGPLKNLLMIELRSWRRDFPWPADNVIAGQTAVSVPEFKPNDVKVRRNQALGRF